MKTITLTAPAHWACYLIYDDASGLDDEDQRACDLFFRSQFGRKGAICVDAEDVGFVAWHDARAYALAADCAEFTFII